MDRLREYSHGFQEPKAEDAAPVDARELLRIICGRPGGRIALGFLGFQGFRV